LFETPGFEQAPKFPQTIGECIYCGRRGEALSDEHVIPFGLGGNWVLREASCSVHRDLTSGFEADALNKAWAAARAALGIRTRRKGRRKEGFDVKLEVGTGVKVVRVPAELHPAPLAWPIYAPPGGTPARAKIPGNPVVRIRTTMRRAAANRLGLEHGASAVRVVYPDPLKFARFLGKVGYCVAVACNGLATTRNAPLLAAVLSDGPEIFKFVGNDDSQGQFTVSDEQEVAMGSNELGRVVYVRLIPALQAQEYIVRIDTPGTG